MMHQETDPSENRCWMIRVAAITGFCGVALGAFGAHGLEDILEAHGRMDVWRTAVLYHLVHAVVLLVLAVAVAAGAGTGAGAARRRGAFLCFFGGIVVFSGSLYVLAVTNIGWLGAVTPLGGVLFLAGWLWLVVTARG